MNQELFKKHFCHRSSHYEKYGQYPGYYEKKLKRANTKSALFAVSKNEWSTKDDTGKSMKNALYVYCSMSKNISEAEVTLNSKKNQTHSLSHS